VQEYAAFEIQHTTQFTQKNENPKLTQGTSPYQKHAWQDTLHAHVHNAMYKLIVHSAQRTQNMQYSTRNSYLIAEVMYFPLHLCCTGVQLLPYRLPVHASFNSVFVTHVPAVPNLRVRLVWTNLLIHSFIYLYSIDHTDVEFVIRYNYKL